MVDSVQDAASNPGSKSSPTTDPQAIQKKMAEGNFRGALAEIDLWLKQDPEQQDALYMSAVCYRYTGQYDLAQQRLDALRDRFADQGRLYQEQGHLHLARDEARKALAAYAIATQLNPALIASWRNQQKILEASGNHPQARQAAAQVQRLEALPKPLLAVTDLLAQGRLVKAEQLCRKFLQASPTDVEGMRLLADIAERFGELDDAEYLLESAAEFEPNNQQVRIDLIKVLRSRQKFSESLALAQTLSDTWPDNMQFKSLYAIEKTQLGQYEEAVELFDTVLETLPGDAVTLTSRGHALKTWGKRQEAVDSYRAAINANPWHGDAYYSLSNLKTYRFDESERIKMLELLRREELDPRNRVYLSFALGKAFEDAEDYSRSFEFYQAGNQLKRRESGYDADKMSEELAAQREYFTPAVLEARTGAGCAAPDPIFIVGLPRAGSTLLEQILSSHSQVDGTLELPNMLTIAQKLRRRSRVDGCAAYPHILGEMEDAELKALGEQYLEETRIHRQSAPFFIDKMPNNFRHIGLIKTILPNAKIIDARRHPMACCFSAFKQLFAEGQEFSYDLNDLGQYYSDYVALMEHWDSVAPGTVLRVQYEEVVADLETQVRRVLDFCGLDFEPACLDFHKTDRAVRTASSEQVRQPIYDSGVEQWRHFQPYLGELQRSLGPVLDAC
ncbi:MAG: sulfotransferase [Halieaceae bacterium]|jgi:tetratricopeptide (TPR) repeat protein|nr:sulfotransferase [Halieaceae bacterium]